MSRIRSCAVHMLISSFFFSSRRRHTRCALVTGVQTCALPILSGIRGRDTKPELVVRKYLHAHGLRYRVATTNLHGKPDITLPRYGAGVFVHGCVWHRHPGCRFWATPRTNGEFWLERMRVV